MPAPNLGLVGARGIGALQNEIQKMEAERRAAAQLERDLRIKQEQEQYNRQLEAEQGRELARHRTALEQYQAGDLEVRRAAQNAPKPASIIQLSKRPGTDPTDKRTYTAGVEELTGKELWRLPEAMETQSNAAGIIQLSKRPGLDPGDKRTYTAGVDEATGKELWRMPEAPEAVDPSLAESRALRNAISRQILQQDLPPNVQKRVDQYAGQFESDPTVKRFAKIGEAMTFVESLPKNTENPQDDQALIYEFAKAMDPDSAVREGEYATVQKYSQSWFESFGFNAQRVLSNSEFLTPQARTNIKSTIRSKFQASRQGYNNVRTQYGKKLEKVTGGTYGADDLIDFAAGFEVAPPAAVPAGLSAPIRVGPGGEAGGGRGAAPTAGSRGGAPSGPPVERWEKDPVTGEIRKVVR